MKSSIELLKVNGVKTPKFNEPKGMEFERVMQEINLKVHKQTVRRNASVEQITKIKEELSRVKAGILMAEDDFEELELKRRKKELQEQLENVDDYSDLNIGEYAKKLINNPIVQKLEAEAREEFINIRNAAIQYEQELDKQYREAKKELHRFLADGGSDSNYRIGARDFNKYNN
jgi:hypothetical protein